MGICGKTTHEFTLIEPIVFLIIWFCSYRENIEFDPAEETLLNPKEKLTKDYLKGFLALSEK